MRTLFVLLLSLLLSNLSGQEICNNGIDDDGDGKIDCKDSECNNSSEIFPIVETFDNGQLNNPNWVLTGSAILNDDWLILTEDLPSQSGNAILNDPFISSSHILVEFDYATIDVNGDNCSFGIGDGLAFFLIDGASQPSIGVPGAALGYSHGTTGDPSNGITGGFLAIGLDEFGNFTSNLAAPNECIRLGSDAVTIRGMQTNSSPTAYPCISTTLLPGNASIDVSSRAEARTVRIKISPDGILDMVMDLNDGIGFQNIFSNVNTGQILPNNLKLGFSSSTGGACISHEIDNLIIGKPSNIEVNIEASDSISLCEDDIQFIVTAINHGPNNTNNILLESNIPPIVNNVSWDCMNCNTTSGTGNTISSEMDMNIGDTIVMIINGELNQSTPMTQFNYNALINFNCTGFLTANINNSFDEDSTFVNDNIDVDLGHDTTICIEAFTLDATTVNAISYLWDDATTMPIRTITDGGIYWVDVLVGNCTIRDSIIVTDLTFDVDLGPDLTLCNQLTTLDATTTNASEYSWQDNSSGPLYVPIGTGIYWVDVTVNGCTVRDSIEISSDLLTIDLGPDQNLCDDPILLDATTIDASYLWQDGSTLPTLSIDSEGEYWVNVTVNQCEARDTVLIQNMSFPLDLGEDIATCEANIILDVLTDNGSYLWQDSSQNSNYIVESDGIYSVLVSNGVCEKSDDIFIEFLECNTCNYYPPTAFTPNNDGKNDVFKVLFECEPTVYFMQIFNRWGEVVYESNNPAEGWDGTYSNTIAPLDVFSWQIAFENNLEENQLIKGTILLIR